MLTTKELEKQIKNEIRSNLGDVSYSNLFFKKGTSRSEEGTYIFNKNNEYHILYTQKGEISLDVVTCEEREVLWYVLNNISISIACFFIFKNIWAFIRIVHFIKTVSFFVFAIRSKGL